MVCQLSLEVPSPRAQLVIPTTAWTQQCQENQYPAMLHHTAVPSQISPKWRTWSKLRLPPTIKWVNQQSTRASEKIMNQISRSWFIIHLNRIRIHNTTLIRHQSMPHNKEETAIKTCMKCRSLGRFLTIALKRSKSNIIIEKWWAQPNSAIKQTARAKLQKTTSKIYQTTAPRISKATTAQSKKATFHQWGQIQHHTKTIINNRNKEKMEQSMGIGLLRNRMSLITTQQHFNLINNSKLNSKCRRIINSISRILISLVLMPTRFRQMLIRDIHKIRRIRGPAVVPKTKVR